MQNLSTAKNLHSHIFLGFANRIGFPIGTEIAAKDYESFEKILESVFRRGLHSCSEVIRPAGGFPTQRWEIKFAGTEHGQKGKKTR